MLTVTAQRVSERMEELGIDQSELARRVGCSAAAINQIVTGKTQHSRLLPTIAARLGVPVGYLTGDTSDKQGWELPAAGNDDEAEIDSIDLAYGMGGAFLDTHDPEVEKAKFSRTWLRQFTNASPELLFSAQGIGDSMWPTIHDRDVVIGDRSSTRVDQADKIWAVVYGGVGMIKRLRPLPDGTVRIMSDNPQVSDELATDGDLHIVGRVAAIVRRV
jgi:phage repressor protein C with HTH and peptisase S24 domain